MRQDVLTGGDWVSIAAPRQNRVFLPPVDQDPLAPQTPGNPSEVPARYDVAVFENRSPSFGPDLAVVPNSPRGLDDLAERGLGRTRTSIGRCEVVCFSPDHEGSFGTQTPSRARTLIEAWADRTEALAALPGRASGDPVRKPRRGDRSHRPSPARLDLRLPLHLSQDTADPRHHPPHRPRPVPAHSRRRAHRGPGRQRRTLDSVRAICRTLADRGTPAATPPNSRLRG
ncbi:hypothetical protein MIC448_620006 [Microbacterium sp. C448]|nr:hypothetical protein MIC448_620006 [Microbacterium sp. C448]